eukprot:1153694-Pelagomonas_calceolata.AAC.3
MGIGGLPTMPLEAVLQLLTDMLQCLLVAVPPAVIASVANVVRIEGIHEACTGHESVQELWVPEARVDHDTRECRPGAQHE